MAHDSPRAFLVDDHWVALAGLYDYLSASGITITGTAKTADGAVEHCARSPEDTEEAITLDLSVDDSGGEDTFRRIRDVRPGARVLVVSMRESLSIMRHLYGLGVDGYVTKSATPDETVTAVKTVAAGKRFYMEGVAEQLLDSLPEEIGVDPRDVLTASELDLVRRVARGHSSEQIADELGITRKTVNNRTRAIRHKLGGVAHADLGWIARKYGLVELDL